MQNLREQQSLFAQLFSVFVILLDKEGYAVTFGEGHRPEFVADIYKKEGKSQSGRNSLHCKKLAHDIFVFKNGKLLETMEELREVGEIWEDLHPFNSWGGFFKGFFDYPHFSMGLEKPERSR